MHLTTASSPSSVSIPLYYRAQLSIQACIVFIHLPASSRPSIHADARLSLLFICPCAKSSDRCTDPTHGDAALTLAVSWSPLLFFPTSLQQTAAPNVRHPTLHIKGLRGACNCAENICCVAANCKSCVAVCI